MSNPDQLEPRYTLLTAATRYDELRMRDALATGAAELAREGPGGLPADPGLTKDEALLMLTLGEVIIRKAGYGRQLAVRSARAAGASWSQIGEGLGTSKQAAWEAHSRWIESLAAAHDDDGGQGLDADDAQTARRLAGTLDDEPD